MLRILQPLEQVTKEICGDTYVTSSKAIHLINCLKHKIEECCGVTHELQNLKKLSFKITQTIWSYRGE